MTLRHRTAGTLLMLVLPVLGLAQTRSMDDVRFTGPLLTPGPAAMPQGEVFAQPYWIYSRTNGVYDDQGNRHALDGHDSSQLLSLSLSGGITDRLTGELVLNGSRSAQGGQHSDGYRIGDSAARLRYQLRAGDALTGDMTLAAMLSQSLATGRHDRLGGNTLNGQGSGVYRAGLSLLGQQVLWMPNGRPLRWRWQTTWSPSPGSVSVVGRSVYGTERSFRGTLDAGAAISGALGLEYSINRNWVLALDLTAGTQAGSVLDGSVADASGQRKALHQNGSRSRAFSAAPAVEYIVNDQIGVLFGVQTSLPGGRNSASQVSPQVSMTMAF